MRIRTLLFAFMASGLLSAPGYAAVITSAAQAQIADLAPADGAPDVQFGGQNGDFSVSKVLGSQGIREDRGFAEFDLSSISGPIGAASLSATLTAAEGTYPRTLELYGYVGDGVIDFADFNAGTLITSFSYDGVSNLQLDVTAFVASLLSASANFAGFSLRQPDVLDGFVVFGVGLGDRVTLTTTAPSEIPLPAALPLFIAGLVGLGFARRRTNPALRR